MPPQRTDETVTVHIGTSGWQYAHWRRRFYPAGLPQRDWLSYYAGRFQAVEVNGTFYRLPGTETFASWAEQTPDDFIFALKLSRYLSHVRRLTDPGEAVHRFLDAAAPLGHKLGPLLLQLPPTFPADLERLDAVLRAFPPGVRIAVEFRHESWFSNEVHGLLERHGAALCLADRGSRPVTPLWRTANWGYIRLHEGAASPAPCYGRTAVAHWAQRICERWEPHEDVFVYFNNDPAGCAVRDAHQLGLALDRVGREHTRTPPPAEFHAG